jgi:pimeloyl-ACP methyl ester carboxylesterase
MAKDIVMIHGANEGGWCFDQFKAVFAGFGWTCPAPDLIGHGLNADKNDPLSWASASQTI